MRARITGGGRAGAPDSGGPIDRVGPRGTYSHEQLRQWAFEAGVKAKGLLGGVRTVKASSVRRGFCFWIWCVLGFPSHRSVAGKSCRLDVRCKTSGLECDTANGLGLEFLIR